MVEIHDSADSAGATGNNIKQIAPSKNWCFTIHNYDDKVINYIVRNIKDYCDVGFFTKELGSNGESPHLQGYLRFKTRKRPKSVFNEMDTIHWSKARGSLQQNIEYCTKETDLYFRIGVPRTPRVYSYQDLFPEQRMVVDFLQTEPDDRSIGVVSAGYAKGKTSLARHIVYHLNGVILPSTKRHALSVARSYPDRYIFLIDLSAEESSEPQTEFFEMIESLKNGLYCSAFGTKGTGCHIADFPHVLIFSNYPSHGWCTDIDKSRFLNFSL